MCNPNWRKTADPSAMRLWLGIENDNFDISLAELRFLEDSLIRSCGSLTRIIQPQSNARDDTKGGCVRCTSAET